MLDWLYNLLGTILAWFTSWTGSYAIALLFYALIFKILFLPFSIKQQKNQIKMAKLTPQIEMIKAKYRGSTSQESQQKMQREIMEFQQKEGYSPFSGCLPLLIQLPLIMWLYNVIRNPLSYIAKFSKETIVALQNAVATVTDGIDAIAIKIEKTTDGVYVAVPAEGANAFVDLTDFWDKKGNNGLPSLGKISSWTYEQLCQLKLKNADGSVSEYILPTFDDVVKACAGKCFFWLPFQRYRDNN